MRRSFILAMTLVLSACQDRLPELKHITGYAQGTTYTISYWHEGSRDQSALQQMVQLELQRIDQLMSNYRPDSSIEQFNDNPVGVVLDQEIVNVLQVGASVHDATGGCYDPTVHSLFKLWGFQDTDFSIPSQTLINDTLEVVGLDLLPLHESQVIKPHDGYRVDMSSIGQGYTVEKLAQIMQQHQITNHLVEIGGEMLATGQKPDGSPWRIGVERPTPNSEKINAVIALGGERPTAVITSGTYRHFYDQDGTRYSHIIDPRSGYPVQHETVAVTVLMNDATQADAWSTGLLCLGSTEGKAIAEAHGVAAIFYDQSEGKLSHQMSAPMANNTQGWEVTFQ